MRRREDLDHFYSLLLELQRKTGGPRYLSDEDCKIGLPQRGVYFFFEPGEFREDHRTPRVVRVGTHAVSEGSRATLWNRLAQHRGKTRGRHAGGGNHRGSIFRQHVGTAILNRGLRAAAAATQWGTSHSPGEEEMRDAEHLVEQIVSQYIRAMPFLWLEVGDLPSKHSHRKLIEANAIGLLTNLDRPVIDPPSPSWLGHSAAHPSVRGSGLWNVDHTAERYDPAFLGLFNEYIR